MNNTNWKVLTIIWLWWIVLTGVGVFATTSSASLGVFNKRPQMMKELWTWDFKEFKNPHVQMNDLLTNLSDEDKEAVESLLTEYREWEKLYFEGLDSATTDADKTALQEKWEASKTTLKEKLLKLVGEDNKEAVENIFSRDHKNELWWERGEGMPCAGGHNIVERFIDTESLSEADKTEIKEIEEKKQEAIQALQDKNQEAMKEINDEYFASIKKFVADDKLEEFEDFVEKADNFDTPEHWFGPWKWRMGGMRWDFNRENGQAPEFNNGERPEIPEMNGERPEFPQGQQMRR